LESRELKKEVGLKVSSSMVSSAFCTLVSSRSMAFTAAAAGVVADLELLSELGPLVVLWDAERDLFWSLLLLLLCLLRELLLLLDELREELRLLLRLLLEYFFDFLDLDFFFDLELCRLLLAGDFERWRLSRSRSLSLSLSRSLSLSLSRSLSRRSRSLIILFIILTGFSYLYFFNITWWHFFPPIIPKRLQKVAR